MSRYRVRVTATFDVGHLPNVRDPETAAAELEGVTTAEFLRLVDAYKHAHITVTETRAHDTGDGEALLERFIATKRGLGGWE